jgi:hypothetical protein
VTEPRGRALWTSDGTSSRRLAVWPAGEQVSALAAGAEGLWAVSYRRGGGAVWHSPDGVAWRATAQITDGAPVAIARAEAEPQPEVPHRDASSVDWDAAGAALDRALADPKSYSRGDTTLRDAIYAAAVAGAPTGFFSGRLDANVPDLARPLLGGKTEASAAQWARWLLLWGAAIGGRERIEPRWLTLPWTGTENSFGKYFETPPAALWAAAQGGQHDRETIDALIGRLELGGDPLWLRGDVVGALSAITTERFAYDAAAWRTWWTAARPGWPPADNAR